MTVLKIEKLQGFVWKTMQAWLDDKFKVVFLIQMFPTVGGRCNRYFWDIRLKILRLPNFNILFQLVLTKLNYFRVYWKLIRWSSHAKSPFKSVAFLLLHIALNVLSYLKDDLNLNNSNTSITHLWSSDHFVKGLVKAFKMTLVILFIFFNSSNTS